MKAVQDLGATSQKNCLDYEPKQHIGTKSLCIIAKMNCDDYRVGVLGCKITVSCRGMGIFVDLVNDFDYFVTKFDKIVIKIIFFTKFDFYIIFMYPSFGICVTSGDLFVII